MSINNPDPNDPFKQKRPDSLKKKPDILGFRTNKEVKKAPAPHDALLDYVRNNTKDSIAYIVLVIGILLMFFDAYSPYGGMAVGIIFSLYFINEIGFALANYKDFIEEYGPVKSLVLGGTLLALFIKAPFVFIGIAIVAVIKMFVWPEEKRF